MPTFSPTGLRWDEWMCGIAHLGPVRRVTTGGEQGTFAIAGRLTRGFAREESGGPLLSLSKRE
ncbi:hypothetical protein GCM10027598_34360 [Amycolatopsis oliviviridis]